MVDDGRHCVEDDRVDGRPPTVSNVQGLIGLTLPRRQDAVLLKNLRPVFLNSGLLSALPLVAVVFRHVVETDVVGKPFRRLSG